MYGIASGTILFTLCGACHELTKHFSAVLYFFKILTDHLPFIIGILPLLTAVGIGCRRWFGHWLATGLAACTMFLGGYLLACTYQGTSWHGAFTWLRMPGGFSTCCLMLCFRVDFLAAMMISLTTTIGFITHLYALTYLQPTEQQRYFIYIGVFVSATLWFFMAEDLISRFIGWEIMGCMSYLLVAFRYRQSLAVSNGLRVWLINQISSISLLMSILILGSNTHSFDLSTLTTLPQAIYCNKNEWLLARYCLLGSICVKTAQFPWSMWLPSAMTAPTPASALIHTTTMVGAGVYLLIDCIPILDMPLTWMAYLGSLTTLLGAYAALVQQRMKYVLAYSTISQLGYAVTAIGVGASGVGLLHLMTHAFGKACLLLCVGAVSYYLDPQSRVDNMQYMGGLCQPLLRLFCAYLLAACSLIGVPGFAGAISKKAVLASTLIWANQQGQLGNYTAYVVPLSSFFATFLTVAYLGRQCYLIFMGTSRWPTSRPSRTPNYHLPWLLEGSVVALSLYSLGYSYGSWAEAIQNSWQLRRLAAPSYMAVTLPISDTLRDYIALGALVSMALGCFFLVIWQVRHAATFRLPHSKITLYGWWHLDRLTHALAKGVLYLSKRTVQFDALGINGCVRGIGVGYIRLSRTLSWLDTIWVHGTLQLLITSYQYIGKAHLLTQQGHWQHILIWMCLGMGLLLGGIYWATSH